MNEKKVNIDGLATELSNDASMQIDMMQTEDIVKLINEEDKKVAYAVEKALPMIANAVEEMAKRYENGGRLIYIGAGTSGRLGVMDAVELIPTYAVLKERAIAIMAGGENAFVQAVEGAEDRADLAIADLKIINLQKEDIVIGLAASGRTPYVIGALNYANEVGALTISVSCNEKGKVNEIAQIPIIAVTGPEVISGSTRMKAGTAQKQILNMLSTAMMIKVGRVYHNYMVYMQPTNQKLEERARQMLIKILDISYEKACDLFENAHKSVACAIVMEMSNCSYQDASEALKNHNDKIREAILSIQSKKA